MALTTKLPIYTSTNLTLEICDDSFSFLKALCITHFGKLLNYVTSDNVISNWKDGPVLYILIYGHLFSHSSK